MTTNLEELERLAQAASNREPRAPGVCMAQDQADFASAASPEVVLELIKRAQAAERKAALYEKVRKMTPKEFSELWQKNLRSTRTFDRLVEEWERCWADEQKAENRRKSLVAALVAEANAKKVLKAGDRLRVTKCPGTKRWITFSHFDGHWIVSKSGIDDYSPMCVDRVNGEAVDFTVEVVR